MTGTSTVQEHVLKRIRSTGCPFICPYYAGPMPPMRRTCVPALDLLSAASIGIGSGGGATASAPPPSTGSWAYHGRRGCAGTTSGNGRGTAGWTDERRRSDRGRRRWDGDGRQRRRKQRRRQGRPGQRRRPPWEWRATGARRASTLWYDSVTSMLYHRVSRRGGTPPPPYSLSADNLHERPRPARQPIAPNRRLRASIDIRWNVPRRHRCRQQPAFGSTCEPNIVRLMRTAPPMTGATHSRLGWR